MSRRGAAGGRARARRLRGESKATPLRGLKAAAALPRRDARTPYESEDRLAHWLAVLDRDRPTDD